jgi:hypothetical protein
MENLSQLAALAVAGLLVSLALMVAAGLVNRREQRLERRIDRRLAASVGRVPGRKSDLSQSSPERPSRSNGDFTRRLRSSL